MYQEWPQLWRYFRSWGFQNCRPAPKAKYPRLPFDACAQPVGARPELGLSGGQTASSLRVTLWCDEAFLLCFPVIPSHTIHKASDDCSGISGGEQEAALSEPRCMLQGRGWLICAQGNDFHLVGGGHYLGVQVRYYQILKTNTKITLHTDVMM